MIAPKPRLQDVPRLYATRKNYEPRNFPHTEFRYPDNDGPFGIAAPQSVLPDVARLAWPDFPHLPTDQIDADEWNKEKS